MKSLPHFLHSGSSVAIVSPSGVIDKKFLDQAVAVLSGWGLHVKVGKYAAARYGSLAGTDSQRLHDLQQALDDTSIQAIFCARGGYGAIRIVEEIDFTAFLQSPKWLIGFSDITVIHAAISKIGVASLHAAMPINFNTITPTSLQALRATLMGNIHPIEWQATPHNRIGKATGRLVGGNLSILYSMRGLTYEYDYKDCILFFEDLGEYIYHIDRIMQNFKLAHILSEVRGIVVGAMSGMKQGAQEFPFGIEDIILQAAPHAHIPIAFNATSGHEKDNMPLIIGGCYNLDVAEHKVTLSLNSYTL